MDDQLIIKKFQERSESAIRALSDKYGKLCYTMANRILHNEQDAEECVNDALLAAWNAIPPANPDSLPSYLCRITRNLSIAKYHTNTAKKRNHYYDLVLDELADSLPGNTLVEDEILAKELGHAINDFLSRLGKLDRTLFIRRYWFLESVSEIAEQVGKSANYVTVHLYRCRKKLEKYLKANGLQ